MIDYVRSNLGLGDRAKLGRLEDQVWDVKFDLVFAPTNVICHIEPEALRSFFEVAHRVALPGGRMVVDTFNPDHSRQPREEYVFREYIDPRDSAPVVVRCRPEYRKDVQVLHLAFFKGDVLQRETDLIQHMHFRDLIIRVARDCEWELAIAYGDYDFRPWTSDSRKQIHVFQKKGRNSG